MSTADELKRRRKRHRIERILEATWAVVQDHGARYPALFEEVAARIAVTRPALYRYFRDRESLLRGVVEWKSSELTAMLRAAVAPHGDVTARVGAVVREALAFQIANPSYAELLLSGSQLRYPRDEHPFRPIVDLVAEQFFPNDTSAGRDHAVMFLSILFSPSFRSRMHPELDVSVTDEDALRSFVLRLID